MPSSNDILAPFLAEVAIISYRDLTTGSPLGGSTGNIKAPPLPSEMLSAVVVFGAFSFIPNSLIRNLLGWGIVIATLVSPTFSGVFTTGSTSSSDASIVGAQATAGAQPVGSAANPKGIGNQ